MDEFDVFATAHWRVRANSEDEAIELARDESPENYSDFEAEEVEG